MAHYPMGTAVMGNGAHGAIVYRGYGVQGYSPHGPWGPWGMGHMGDVDTWKWGTGCVGRMASEAHRANGYRGYGAHRQ